MVGLVGWAAKKFCPSSSLNRSMEYIAQEVKEALLPAIQNQSGNTFGDTFLKLFTHLFICPTHNNGVCRTTQALR